MNNKIVMSAIIFLILLGISIVIFESDDKEEVTAAPPAETLVEVPAETTVAVPTEASVAVTVETTVVAPTEASVTVTAEATVVAPAETTVVAPAETAETAIAVAAETSVVVMDETTDAALTETLVVVPLEASVEVPAMSAGEKDYQALCGSCHGKDGKGHGLKVSTLQSTPSDLTALSQKNGGYFPYVKIRRVIDGRVEKGYFRAHHTGEMPVWGDVFTSEKGNSVGAQLHARAASKMRILDLVDYLATIQK